MKNLKSLKKIMNSIKIQLENPSLSQGIFVYVQVSISRILSPFLVIAIYLGLGLLIGSSDSPRPRSEHDLAQE